MSLSLAELNSASSEAFVQLIGPVFEHSPWIAAEVARHRPFSDLESLHRELCRVVNLAGKERHLQLIRAHPDLVGRLALAGQLSQESTREQASAGLGALTPEEVQLFQANNARYRARFGFPFVICARLSKKEAILQGFAARLHHTPEQEVVTALEEIYKIAGLRLRDVVRD